MAFSILFQENIEINRPTENQGYVNETGDWVTASTVTVIPMKGSIQPYRSSDISKGEESLPFRDGYDYSSARTVFTDQSVFPVSRKKNREPDYILIDGEEFVCWDVFTHMNSPLVDLRHCESIFVERSALRSG